MPIHDYITNIWELKEKPVANIREGDPKTFVRSFEKKGCKVNKHQFGYRSVHYIVKFSPSKRQCFAEIQVRTIFEEGWSEIDHMIRYPYDIDNPIIGQFLVIFNRLAGSADEMGSFIRFLKEELESRESQYQNNIQQKTNIITQLKEQVDKLNIQKRDRAQIKSNLNRISDIKLFEMKPIKLPDFAVKLPDLQFADYIKLSRAFKESPSSLLEKHSPAEQKKITSTSTLKRKRRDTLQKKYKRARR